MTGRGDWITLGVLGALTAGAALRGRSGGRNFTAEAIERDREAWAHMVVSEDGIRDLNKVQRKGLLQGQVLLPDGSTPEEVLVFGADRLHAYEVRVEVLYQPTVRGPRPYQPKLWLSEAEDAHSAFYSRLLVLWDGEKYQHFLLPEEWMQDTPEILMGFE